MSQTSCHIVLIEDNPADVYLVQEALRTNQIPCNWTIFRTYEDALDAVSQSAIDRADAMLVDVNLRTGSGLEILSAVRQSPRLRNTAVAVLTSSDSPRDRDSAIALGADLFVRKPTSLDEFIEVISSAVVELLNRASSEVPRADSRGTGM